MDELLQAARGVVIAREGRVVGVQIPQIEPAMHRLIHGLMPVLPAALPGIADRDEAIGRRHPFQPPFAGAERAFGRLRRRAAPLDPFGIHQSQGRHGDERETKVVAHRDLLQCRTLAVGRRGPFLARPHARDHWVRWALVCRCHALGSLAVLVATGEQPDGDDKGQDLRHECPP